MGDENLKKELLYMVRMAQTADFKNKEIVDEILDSKEADEIFTSVFGQRFKERISQIADGTAQTRKCVICGRMIARNGVICDSCMNSIGNSEYAKNEIRIKEKEKQEEVSQETEIEKTPEIKKTKVKKPKKVKATRPPKAPKAPKTPKAPKAPKAPKQPKFSNQNGLPKWLQITIMVCLIVILLFQSTLLIMLLTLPDYNELEEAHISTAVLTPVSSMEEARAQVEEEYPAEDGWTIYDRDMGYTYAGYFDLEPGTCCQDYEAQVTETEAYDFYWGVDTYQFIVTYKDYHTGKMALVQVNDAGHIIVCGKMNDGRDSSKYYVIK